MWRADWALPFEGPLTLLWKLADANCLYASQLCRLLWRKPLLPGGSAQVHGRTLLVPAWMNGAPSQLGLMVRQSGLDRISSRWATSLASDRYFRFCRSCLSEGYQSIFCQIDGLQACPIHHEPLHAACPHCGEPTPRYAVTRLSMAAPFRCPLCGAYYGRQPYSVIVRHYLPLAASSFEPYARIMKWLSAIDMLQLTWPRLEDWQVGCQGEMDDVARRRGVFLVFTRLRPLVCAESNALPHLHIAERFDHVPPRSESDDHALMPAVSGDETLRRIMLYRALRRHFKRALQRRHRRCFAFAARCVHIEWGIWQEMFAPPEICPEVFGFLLWRHHFEEMFGYRPAGKQSLCLRKEILGWPRDEGVTTAAWGAFALISLAAFRRVAFAWCEQVSEIAGLNGTARKVRWREIFGAFRTALSPHFWTCPPSVTALHLLDEERLEGVCLVVDGHVGHEHDVLTDQHPHGRPSLSDAMSSELRSEIAALD
ncbi:Uncharacterized protein ToN1_48060 [Aromatoleum petrolei]|nr:Uncharacterized protein ToN1_48060 [Aromatoleum petrolei]